MPSSAILAGVVAAIAALPAVSAHGYVASATIGGTSYFVGNPNWSSQPSKPAQPGWYANNQDNGFVSPSAYQDPDIICHKNATPGSTYLTAAAGTTIGLVWNTWPDSHKGPIINSLAAVSGDFSAIDKTRLGWYTAEADSPALIDDSSPPGTWVTDTMIANKFTANFKVPANIAAGNYVLRHEIIALHAAGSENGAQNYPMCINLKITGGGSASIASGGTLGTALYKSTDPGILIDIYSKISNYIIPGPAVWSGFGGTGGGSSAAPTSAAPTSAKPTSAAPTSAAPTTAKPSSTLITTTKAATSSAAAPAGSCAAKYAQCGGQGWTGPTCCVSGSKCTANGQYYSQCT